MYREQEEKSAHRAQPARKELPLSYTFTMATCNPDSKEKWVLPVRRVLSALAALVVSRARKVLMVNKVQEVNRAFRAKPVCRVHEESY